MILDDLFNFAAQKSPATVTVQANVTTNHTGGLHTQTNTTNVQDGLTLTYYAAVPINEGGIHYVLPASFQSNALSITAPRPQLHGALPYLIEWQGNAFAGNVDVTTNIVYGVAGQQFITISLCDEIAAGQ